MLEHCCSSSGSAVTQFDRAWAHWLLPLKGNRYCGNQEADLALPKWVLPEILETGYFLFMFHVLWVMKFANELWLFSCTEVLTVKGCTGQNHTGTAACSPVPQSAGSSCSVLLQGVWTEAQHQCTRHCYPLGSLALSSCKSPAVVCSAQVLVCCWHCMSSALTAGWPAPVLQFHWWLGPSWETRLWHPQEFIACPRLLEWVLGAPWKSSAACSLEGIATHCTLGWSWELCSSRDANFIKKQV